MAYSDIYLAVFGTPKPKVPAAPHVDPATAAADASAIEKSQVPALADLTSKFDQISADQLSKAIDQFLPGYKETQAQSLASIKDMIAGTQPGFDEYANRISAEAGVAQGTGPGGSFSTGRNIDIGFTQRQQLINQGLSRFDQWVQASLKPQLHDFSQLLWTPQQQVALQQWNEENRYGQQWLQNQINAIPPGWQQALNQTLGYLENTAKDVGSKWLGGAGSSKDNMSNSAVTPQQWYTPQRNQDPFSQSDRLDNLQFQDQLSTDTSNSANWMDGGGGGGGGFDMSAIAGMV